VPESTVDITDRLDAGATAVFTLTAPADALSLGGFGVYPLGVEARGRLGAAQSTGSTRLGITRTFLPWMPATVAPTQVSWLWPLIDTPSRDATGVDVESGEAGGTNDRLVTELASDGRLGRLVSEGAYLPVTWVVDPDLLDAAAALAGSATAAPVATPAPTEEATPTPTPTPTPTDAGAARVAQQWLGTLSGGTTGAEVVALPYADPDVVALHRAGLDADLRQGHETGTAVARRVLGRFVTSDVAWPAGGLLDQASADTLAEIGFGATILDPAARPAVQAPSYTPDGRTDLKTATGAGRLAGLVYDRTLSSLVAADTSAPGQQALVLQRFLAETAMITAERPADTRTVLIAPPREWAPAQGMAERFVEASTRAAWVAPVPLSTLRAQPPDQAVRLKALTYPDTARKAELAPAHLARVSALENDVATFSQVLTEPDALLPPYQNAALRLSSIHWREHPGEASRLATAVTDDVTALRESVKLVATPVTFGSKTGTFPLTIVNRLDQAVIVDLTLSPRTPRLEVRPTEPLTIRAQRSEQANITASANANGLVFVDARLRTPVGEPLGPVVSFRVTVTQIGTMGLLVTVGAAAVLFVAAGVRVGRRAVLARRRSQQP
jgi:hypothetical protein